MASDQRATKARLAAEETWRGWGNSFSILELPDIVWTVVTFKLRGAFGQKQDVAFSQAVVEIFEHFKRLKLTSDNSLFMYAAHFWNRNVFNHFIAI